MEKGKILAELIAKKGYSVRAFAKLCGIPDSTLRSILKNVGGASVDTVILICKHLQITVEELECMSKGIEYKGKSFNELQSLIARNGKVLTLEEKQNLIKTLLQDDE